MFILVQFNTFCCSTIEVSSYSKVAKNGVGDDGSRSNSSENHDLPRVHRAREGVLNTNLWFPKV